MEFTERSFFSVQQLENLFLRRYLLHFLQYFHREVAHAHEFNYRIASLEREESRALGNGSMVTRSR